MAEAQSAVDLPLRWPLVVEPQNRDESTSKDARLVNCYMETQQGLQGREYWIYKRPGLLEASQPPGGAATGRGVFNWRGNIYAIFGSTLYKDGVAVVGSVDTTAGVYAFGSCRGATPRLVFGNGVAAYYYDTSGGLVHITEPDFPTSFVKGWAYLDGPIYVMTPSADIQGSDFNDPSAWDPLNDLVAQIEPDQGVALAKQLVYVIALKEWTTEVFHDAGNATGSPLAAVQGAKINFGCETAGSVQDIDGALIWLSGTRSAGMQVVLMDQLKAESVSTKPLERLLETLDWSTTYSWQISRSGHRFYVLTSKASNLTLAFDLDERAWAQWTDVDGDYLPIVSSTFDSSMRAVLQHESNGKLYYGSQAYLNDDGVKIVGDIFTPPFDGGTARNKVLYRQFFLADQVPGSTLRVRTSDDDYRTWSPPRRVDLGQVRPSLDNCGTFKRRAQWLRHEDSTAFRLKAIDLQIEVGGA